MGRIIQGEIGIPFPCQRLETGQIIQYSNKKDDGYFEKGKERLFVPLILGQYSGTVDIVLNAKTHALSNNCVFDKKTGLIWARYVPDGDIGPDGNGKLLWVDDVNDEDIFDFKDQADTKELGGHSDWRVPNLAEVFSLWVNNVTPNINAVAFPSTPAGSLWTSTTKADGTALAYYCTFAGYTYISADAKATSKNYCRLVRGPK